MSAIYMPLYIGDYLKDTRHLTTEQHGAYLLLLMSMWSAGGTLKHDDKLLARMAGCTPARWAKISPEVMDYFTVQNGELTHGRLTKEIEKAQEKANIRAQSGKRGGEATALKNKELAQANAARLPQHSSGQDRYIGSEDKSSDAVRVVVDHDRDAWTQAVTLLTGQGGMAETKARPFFGRLLAVNNLEARDLLPSLARATVTGTQDPQGYLTKAAGAIAKRRNGAPAKEKRVTWV